MRFYSRANPENPTQARSSPAGRRRRLLRGVRHFAARSQHAARPRWRSRAAPASAPRSRRWRRAACGVRRRRVRAAGARAGREARTSRRATTSSSRRPTPLELLEKLTRGDVTQAEVRLIEGWTFGQFRALLNASPDLRHDTADLEDAADPRALQGDRARIRRACSSPTPTFSPRGSSDLAVLRRAYRAMQRHLQAEWEARGERCRTARPTRR